MGDSNSLLGGWAASSSCQPLATEYPSRFNHPLSDWRAVAFLAAPKGLAEVPDPSASAGLFCGVSESLPPRCLGAIGRPTLSEGGRCFGGFKTADYGSSSPGRRAHSNPRPTLVRKKMPGFTRFLRGGNDAIRCSRVAATARQSDNG